MTGPRSTSELYEALEAIAPELEALSREAEIKRSAPDALAALLKQARIPMAKVPREVGGYEIPPSEHVDYFARIAYLNPTAGWLAFNQSGSAGLAARGKGCCSTMARARARSTPVMLGCVPMGWQ